MNNFFSYILKRIAVSIITILFTAVIVFGGSKMLPGSPFRDQRKLSPEAIKNIEKQNGFDKPYYVQFFKMLKNIFTFNCLSIIDNSSLITPIFFKDDSFWQGAFCQSLLIATLSALMMFIIGIFLGSLFALKDNFFLRLIEKFVIFLNSLPAIILANLTVYFLQSVLSLNISNVLFISFVYMLPNIYTISEQTKNLIQGKLNTEYIKFLKLKGLGNKKIFFKHILVTSIVPLISNFFSTIVSLMASLTVIESAFSLAGIAHNLNSLILRREYNGILFLSMLFAVMNVIAKNIEDLILKKMDPTIKI